MSDLIDARSALIAAPWRQRRLALMDAARGHDCEGLRACINSGANIEWRDPKSGSTALGLCARAGFEMGVDRLLWAGADPNARDKLGRSPLILAAIARDAGCARSLLSNGADAEAVDAHGHGALDACARSFATLSECSGVVQALSRHIGVRSAQRALREASIFGCLGAAQAIVEHFALPPTWVAGAGKAGLSAWDPDWQALWDRRASDWLQKEGFVQAERKAIGARARMGSVHEAPAPRRL